MPDTRSNHSGVFFVGDHDAVDVFETSHIIMRKQTCSCSDGVADPFGRICDHQTSDWKSSLTLRCLPRAKDYDFQPASLIGNPTLTDAQM